MNCKNTLVKILKEYVILEKLKEDFDIEPAKREDVEVFIQRHYLKKFPTGIKRIYAIYQKHTEGRHMVGMIVYGVPFMTAGKFLEPEVNPREVLELKRLYIDDIGVKNLESFVISQSLGLLKRDEPTIKVVLTFADDLQGHVGGIYQATNAIYLGKSESGKHKYVYILRGNLNAIKDKLKPFIQPYPKKEIPIEPITENEEKHLTPAEEETYDELVDKFLRTINQAFSEVSPNENGITRDQLVIRLHLVANNDDLALRLSNDPSIKSTGARNWFKEGKFIEQTLIKLGTDKKEIESLYHLMRKNVGNTQKENKRLTETKYLSTAELSTYDSLLKKFTRVMNKALEGKGKIAIQDMELRLALVAINDFAPPQSGLNKWFDEGKRIEQILKDSGINEGELKSLYNLMKKHASAVQKTNESIKLKDIITEISKEELAKAIQKLAQMPSLKTQMDDRDEKARREKKVRQERLSVGKCILDGVNDAYKYPNGKKSLLCKKCIQTKFDPKRSNAVLAGKCSRCMNHELLYRKNDKRMATVCIHCNERRVGLREDHLKCPDGI